MGLFFEAIRMRKEDISRAASAAFLRGGVGMESKMGLPKGFPEELYKKPLEKGEKSTQVCIRCGEPFRETESCDPSSTLDTRVSDLCGSCREQILCRCLQRGLHSKNLQGRLARSAHQEGGE